MSSLKSNTKQEEKIDNDAAKRTEICTVLKNWNLKDTAKRQEIMKGIAKNWGISQKNKMKKTHG